MTSTTTASRSDAADATAHEEIHWLVRRPTLTAAALLIVVQVAVRASLMRDSFFITDDFMLSTRAYESPLDLSYLTRVHTGHFEPVGFLWVWLIAHAAPLSWGPVVLVAAWSSCWSTSLCCGCWSPCSARHRASSSRSRCSCSPR